MTATTLSDPSGDWRDQEIHYLRGEVEKLRAEVERLRRADPMRDFERRERGINLADLV